jgi:hypothetical protein
LIAIPKSSQFNFKFLWKAPTKTPAETMKFSVPVLLAMLVLPASVIAKGKGKEEGAAGLAADVDARSFRF